MTSWDTPPQRPRLGPGEVHVWRARLDAASAAFQDLLSEDELERAARFRFEVHRRRFIVARGMLRILLEAYGTEPAAALRFCYGERGKPALACAQAPRFNVAHSEDAALFVFSMDREVGIDIERHREDVVREGLAKQLFSPHELAELSALPPHLQVEGFFNCWTRKEAYIKGLGQGLYVPLDAFDVTLTPGQDAALLSHRGGDAARWSLRALDVEDAYAAAVAVEGGDFVLRCWDFAARQSDGGGP